MEAEYVQRWRNNGTTGYVSTLYHCSTDKITDLCFYDLANKFKHESQYDIGGTYTGEQPDFWFYYTTSMCHGYNYLLNLFVLPRKPSNFSIFLPKSNKLSCQLNNNDMKLVITYGPQTELTFRTSQNDEQVYIKTFLFSDDDVDTLENCVLLMPLTLQRHTKLHLDPNIVRMIKLRHNLSNLMTQKESADFTLLSNTGKKHVVHTVVAAAHSSVLRSVIKNSEKTHTLDVSDEVIEIIIEFLYTGTVSKINMQDYVMLMDTAERLKLANLFDLAQLLLVHEINVQNAIGVAVIAKKFNLEELKYKVFAFIKTHPEVLSTEGWHCSEDIDLVKQLLQYLHPPKTEAD